MPFTSPNHLKFNHVYSETIVLGENQQQPEAFRVVKRDGTYSAPLTYGAGVTFLGKYGVRNLAFNGVGVSPAINIPNLKTAIAYPAGGTAVLAGAVLKNANTNTFYSVPANVTLATGSTLAARIAADLASGAVILIPQNIILNNLNASTNPYAPAVLGHQRNISMCTDGIAIVEIATVASAASSSVTVSPSLTVDQPLYVVDAFGRVGTPSTIVAANYVIGRCMDAVTVPASVAGFNVPAGYVRIKLGSI